MYYQKKKKIITFSFKLFKITISTLNIFKYDLFTM